MALTSVRSCCVQTITVAADQGNICALINVGTRTVVRIQSKANLTAAFKAAGLVDANLLAKPVLILALINVPTSLIVISDFKSFRTLAVSRTHCIDTLVATKKLPIGAFICVFAIALLIDGKSWRAVAVVRTRGVNAQV